MVNLLANTSELLCVCHPTQPLGLSQATAAFHMKKLMDAGLLEREQRGVQAYYSSATTGRRLSAASSNSKEANDERAQRRSSRAVPAAATSSRRGMAADDVTEAACCEPTDGYALKFYDTTSGDAPDEAVLASWDAATPRRSPTYTKATVLDPGSGGGIDVLRPPSGVGLTGFVYGLDMTDEMLELARENARADAGNVEFLKGFIEDIPLPDAAVDVIISNCAINLSTDKPGAIREMFRTLRPGGRLPGSATSSPRTSSRPEDIERNGAATSAASPARSRSGNTWMSCAPPVYVSISTEPTHEAADQMYGAIVKAVKPAV